MLVDELGKGSPLTSRTRLGAYCSDDALPNKVEVSISTVALVTGTGELHAYSGIMVGYARLLYIPGYGC